MAIFRCKMCGGDLEVSEGTSVFTCEFCGTQQTLPTVNDEALQVLFNRANVLRMKSEFDKAAEVYEKILQKSDKEAEAYWGLILCKYGIEYVEDPATFKRIPTCHRASYDAVTADEDYKNALANADAVQRSVYEAEAKAIDEIQKGIIALAQREDPYDVFICYKETDESGKRTQDSVIANDIYHQLTLEGFKVFYAAITLEDKLGKEYEPYIFSALNTAKVMLALGTKPEYFNAVWVKNEWSRFLKIMKKDRTKLLIPCYRDMDAYELPEEFAHLQAQNMGKIGFINDVVRGIKKVVEKEAATPAPQEAVGIQQAAAASGTSAAAQIKRGNMALEDQEWEKANAFFEEALNLDPECAEAYLGKLLARDKKPGFASWITMQKERNSSFDTIRYEACPKETNHIFDKAEEYALADYLTRDEIAEAYKFDRYYHSALTCRKRQKERQLAELSSDRLLTRAQQYAKGTTLKQLADAIAEITALLDKRIADAQAEDEASIARVKAAYAAHIAEADKKVEELYAVATTQKEAAEQKAKKLKKMMAIFTAIAVACIAFLIVLTKVIIPNNKYNAAVSLMSEGKYTEAITAFEAIEGYKDSAGQISNAAVSLMNAGKYAEAIAAFNALNGYEGSAEQCCECEIAMLRAARVGDTVFFGTYEQDNKTSNGKEDIEWIVLAKANGKALVISKQALDYRQYNTSNTKVTWESCSLRKWMNGTFLNNAFSAEEQARIQSTTVSADKNRQYSTNPGNATTDKVFLFSITEAEKYFTTEESRRCAPTAYAKAQGAKTSDSYKTSSGEASCSWWLRSPGEFQTDAADVFSSGWVFCGGWIVDFDDCVRPALWINLES